MFFKALAALATRHVVARRSNTRRGNHVTFSIARFAISKRRVRRAATLLFFYLLTLSINNNNRVEIDFYIMDKFAKLIEAVPGMNAEVRREASEP